MKIRKPWTQLTSSKPVKKYSFVFLYHCHLHLTENHYFTSQVVCRCNLTLCPQVCRSLTLASTTQTAKYFSQSGSRALWRTTTLTRTAQLFGTEWLLQIDDLLAPWRKARQLDCPLVADCSISLKPISPQAFTLRQIRFQQQTSSNFGCSDEDNT